MTEASKAVKNRNKIYYIEPNDLPAFMTARSMNGQELDNITWNQEDLNISVDLQVVIPSRQYNPADLEEYGDFNFNEAKYQSILSGAKLKPGENFLTDDWTVMSYQEIKSNRAGSKEMLGINSIQITFDSHMYPIVTMNFTDVRGSALMQPQEQRYLDLNSTTREGASEATKNFFASIFKFPYPRFLLSVKGVYGTCVTFVLSVEDFKTQFSSESGNFDVNIKFIGNMYGLYTDIPMNYLLIAPYIGSKSGGLTTNEYWDKQTSENGAFHFCEDGAKGAPIITFLEFYGQYHNAMVNKEISNATGEALLEMAEISKEAALLTGEKGILSFYQYIPNATVPVGEYVLTSENGMSRNAIFFDDDVEEVVFDDVEGGFAHMLHQAVENYKNLFPNGFFRDKKAYMVFDRLCDMTQTVFLTQKVDMNADCICSTLSKTDSDIVRSLKPEIRNRLKRVFVYDGSFKADVDKYVRLLNAKREEKVPEATKEINSFFKEIFQFTPTVENIMRMLFAHIDAFIHKFYSVIMEIPGTRTLGSLGNYPKELTDIESSSGQDAHVPPYTGFFRLDGEGKAVRIYPGEDLRLANIAEVGFVEDILNGIGSITKWKEALAEDSEEGETEETEEEKKIDIEFLPSMVSDIFYDGKNPYDDIMGSLYPLDLLYFFVGRYFAFNASDENVTRREGKEFVEREARNFINSTAYRRFTRIPVFKDTVNKIVEGDMQLSTGATVNQFSPKKWTICRIDSHINGEHTVGSRNDSKNPLKFNGLREPDLSYSREEKSGYNVLTEYGRQYVEDFANKLADKGREIIKIDLNYEDRTFLPEKDVTAAIAHYGKTIDYNSSPMIPLTYGKLSDDSGNFGYFPFKDKTKNGKVKIDLKKFSYYTKEHGGEKFHSKGEGNETVDFKYKSFDDLIKNCENDGMWIPYILWRDKNNTLQNLLVKFPGNPAITKGSDGKYRTAAFWLLSSLFIGEEDVKTASAKMKMCIADEFPYLTGVGSRNDWAKSITKAEYLFFCGLAYAAKHYDSEINSKFSDAIEAVNKGFLPEEIERMSDYYIEWVDNEYEINVASAIGEQWNDVVSDDKKIVVKPGTNLQNYLIELYKTVVVPFYFRHMNDRNSEIELPKKDIIRFFKKIKEEMDNVPVTAQTYDAGPVEVNLEFAEDTKNAIYYTLKNLYDRWLSMLGYEDFRLYSVEEENEYKLRKMTNGERIEKDRSEFCNFVYVDSFYNDIGRKFMINPEKLFQSIGLQFNGEVSYNVLEFIGKVCQDNKLLFRCLPVYSNVYSEDTFAEIFTPHSLYDGSTRTGRRVGNTYMIMYTYEPSHFLDLEQDKSDGVNYGNDSFDIADSFGDITQEACEIMQKTNKEKETNYSVCAFGVTAAKQNQSYFSKINVGMDNPRVTDYAIMNKFQLANMGKKGGTENVIGVGQDLYSVYSNRSYDCSVEMLGCANIMPMMYFQLNNVPMFKGVYMITKVEHSISNNNMTTKFTGTRMPKRYIPMVTNVFSLESINEAVNNLANADMTKKVKEGETEVNVSVNNEETTPVTDRKPTPIVVTPPTANTPIGSKPVGPEGTQQKKAKSFPKGETFYVWSAVKQMTEAFMLKNGKSHVPFANTYNDNCGRCATAVQTFLMAGFNGYIPSDSYRDAVRVDSKRLELGFNGCNGYEMYKCLENYGFVCIANYATKDTCTFQAGDVCVTKKYKGSPTPVGVGHVTMYAGAEMGGKWVSDFTRAHDPSWWVYPGNEKYLHENDVLFYRFDGNISLEHKVFGE